MLLCFLAHKGYLVESFAQQTYFDKHSKFTGPACGLLTVQDCHAPRAAESHTTKQQQAPLAMPPISPKAQRTPGMRRYPVCTTMRFKYFTKARLSNRCPSLRSCQVLPGRLGSPGSKPRASVEESRHLVHCGTFCNEGRSSLPY